MNVGELFVNLGIKGSEKTLGAISDTKSGLTKTAQASLEMKAGIIAAMYAFQRLVGASGAVGTNMANFNALTGQSVKELQQWQYAARQAGVATQDMESSVKGVQNAMIGMLTGQAPKGLALIASKVGFDEKRARDTFYVLDKLQQYAKTAPPDIGNLALRSFGLSDGVIAGMRRGKFDPKALSQAPTYSEGQLANLDKANIAWSNLGAKIERAVGAFNAKHGGQLVKDFSSMTDGALKFADALQSVSERFKVIETGSKFLLGIANVLKLAAEVTDRIAGKDAKPGDLTYTKGDTVPGLAESPVGRFFKMLGDLPVGDAAHFMVNGPDRTKQNFLPTPYGERSWAAPRMSGLPGPKTSTKVQEVKVNQTLIFQHEGKDAARIGNDVRKVNQDAYRQFEQGQEN